MKFGVENPYEYFYFFQGIRKLFLLGAYLFHKDPEQCTLTKSKNVN